MPPSTQPSAGSTASASTAPPLAGDEYAFIDFHSLGFRVAIYEIRGVPIRGLVGQPTRFNLSIVNLLTGERTCLSSPPERISRVLLYGDLVLTWEYFDRAIHYCRLEAAD